MTKKRFKAKNQGFGGTPGLVYGRRYNPAHIANDRLRWKYITCKYISLTRWKLFVAFEQYDMTHFLSFSFTKVKNYFSKKRFILYIVQCSSMSWFQILPWFCTKRMPCLPKQGFEAKNLDFWETHSTGYAHRHAMALWWTVHQTWKNNQQKFELNRT